jgi:dUTP pyrophosphatase
MEIKIKKLYEDSIIPTRGSDYAAGYDLYAYIHGEECATRYILPHETVLIGTGVAIQPPKDTFGAVFARSGLASKQGLRPANCVGVCDYDYTGEYMIALHNDSNTTKTVKHGDRIGQVVFIPYVNVNFVEVDELEETDRGDGGFGSTGV